MSSADSGIPSQGIKKKRTMRVRFAFFCCLSFLLKRCSISLDLDLLLHDDNA